MLVNGCEFTASRTPPFETPLSIWLVNIFRHIKDCCFFCKIRKGKKRKKPSSSRDLRDHNDRGVTLRKRLEPFQPICCGALTRVPPLKLWCGGPVERARHIFPSYCLRSLSGWWFEITGLYAKGCYYSTAAVWSRHRCARVAWWHACVQPWEAGEEEGLSVGVC